MRTIGASEPVAHRPYTDTRAYHAYIPTPALPNAVCSQHTTGLDNAGAGAGSEAQGAHGQLGGGEHALVVSDSADNDGGLAVLALHLARHLGDGQGSTVHAAHKEALEDRLVEGRVCAARKEPVELHEKAEAPGEMSTGNASRRW